MQAFIFALFVLFFLISKETRLLNRYLFCSILLIYICNILKQKIVNTTTILKSVNL